MVNYDILAVSGQFQFVEFVVVLSLFSMIRLCKQCIAVVWRSGDPHLSPPC